MRGPRPSRGIVLLLAALAAACSAPVREYTCDVVPRAASPAVEAVWQCNRDVMVRAAGRKAFSIREFRAAAEFFESLTGIAADSRASRQGPLPGPALGASVEAWDRWYREHRDRLSWDAETGSIRVARAG